MDDIIDYNHHSFEPSLKNLNAEGCCLCEHCGEMWDSDKHKNWKGERIPMKNAGVIIVDEDGTSERCSSDDLEEGDLE